MAAKAKPKRKTRAEALAGNQNAAGNKGGSGRPPTYNATCPERAFRLTLLGATDLELGAAFGVAETTINAWKREHPEFSAALNAGKLEADAHIASALYHRAKGYSHKAVKIFNGPDGVIEVPYTEHYAPDTAAAKHWLNNRRPAQWRERQPDDNAMGLQVSFTISGLDDVKVKRTG